MNRHSAQSVCERLRLRDAYLAREDSLSEVERDQVIVMEVEAMLEARKDDAEPGLREIVWDRSVNDRGPTIERMIGWCQENTEPVGDTAPW
ncbi:hypothetical protein [Nocardiopsis sp. M1B1]|uniref:hypothetical protein n=1 Tax=Nocardiopsis sp. M1B1 TaxID=3450454 RepID=UPI0040396ADA